MGTILVSTVCRAPARSLVRLADRAADSCLCWSGWVRRFGAAESPQSLLWRLSRSGHGRVSGQRRLWRGEAEELEREPVGVAVADAQLRGDVRYLMQVQDADDRVADGGHGLVRAADAAGVLAEGDITDIVVHFD